MAMSHTLFTAPPVVYVVQDLPGKNMVSALDYGSMELLLESGDEPTVFNIPQLTRKLQHELQWMRPSDYLLLSGSPIAIAIAASVAARVTGGRYNVLKWDPQGHKYWPVVVDLNQES